MNRYSILFKMAAVLIPNEYVAPTFNMATEFHESVMNIAAMLNTGEQFYKNWAISTCYQMLSTQH